MLLPVGPSCHFAHNKEVPQVCTYFQQGSCFREDQCSSQDLQPLVAGPRIPRETGVCRVVSAQTAPVALQQPLQLGQVRAAFCLLRPRDPGQGRAPSPGSSGQAV